MNLTINSSTKHFGAGRISTTDMLLTESVNATLPPYKGSIKKVLIELLPLTGVILKLIVDFLG